MDKNQNENDGGNIFSQEFGNELKEKDLINSLPSSEISPMITIKELINS
jgi:hypothetical protein